LVAFTSYFGFAYFRNYIRKAGASAVILASENSTIQPIRNKYCFLTKNGFQNLWQTNFKTISKNGCGFSQWYFRNSIEVVEKKESSQFGYRALIIYLMIFFIINTTRWKISAKSVSSAFYFSSWKLSFLWKFFWIFKYNYNTIQFNYP
jgi:hypothetical protein